MRQELQEQLFDKYPELFAQRKLPMTETCMCWGIECRDGWYWLIDLLCSTIQLYSEDNLAKIPEATQVKEKYGSLRFYITGGDEFIAGMISFAENLSAHICENCGSTQDVSQTTEGWIHTLCSKCHKLKEE